VIRITQSTKDFMVTGIWGQKIGMTQFFSFNADNTVRAVPVTVIDIGDWYVTQIKTSNRDGYDALQIGYVRDKYKGTQFSADWLKKPKKHFQYLREIRSGEGFALTPDLVGQPLAVLQHFSVGAKVDVTGWSRGLGFQGVYKRHGFGGAAKSHGSMMGRRPGSIGFTRSSGEVMRGQLMAGHTGTDRTVIQNLDIIAIEPEKNIILVQGSIPGKSRSLVYVKKSVKNGLSHG
jgi:large subunit ribosomal protein L3